MSLSPSKCASRGMDLGLDRCLSSSMSEFALDLDQCETVPTKGRLVSLATFVGECGDPSAKCGGRACV